LISPIASALILNNPLPSPLNKDADIVDDILTEPVTCALPLIDIGEFD
jgi:hypothetical protein